MKRGRYSTYEKQFIKDNAPHMPYVEIAEDEYEKLAHEFPEIDFSKIYRYEEEDYTTAAQELACMAGNCDM